MMDTRGIVVSLVSVVDEYLGIIVDKHASGGYRRCFSHLEASIEPYTKKQIFSNS